jgi:hypothetical protein
LLTVSPTTLYDEQVAHVELSGFATEGTTTVGICPQSYVDGWIDHGDALHHCSVLHVATGGTVSEDLAVPDQNSPFLGGAGFTCSELPEGCAVFGGTGTGPIGESTISEFTSVPVTIRFGPWTLTTSTDVVPSRGSVDVTTSGFAAGEPGTIGLCPSFPGIYVEGCLPLATYPAGIPASTTVTVPYQFTQDGISQLCEVTCSIAAWVVGDPGPPPTVTAYAEAPIQVQPPPLVVTPNEALVDGETLTVQLSGVSPGSATLRQCLPNASEASDDVCSAPVSATVDATGSMTASFVFRNPFTSVDGTSYSCLECSLLVQTADGTHPYTASLSGPTISGPTSPVRDGRNAGFVVQRFPGTSAVVALCAMPLGTDLESSQCTGVVTVPLDEDGLGVRYDYVVHRIIPGPPAPVDCLVEDCALVGFDGVSHDVLASTPLRFQEDPSMTLTPSSGRHDGDAMTLDAIDLIRNGPYVVRRCSTVSGSAPRCADVGNVLWADADGRLTTTVAAVQRFDSGGFYRRQYCRANCTIRLVDLILGEVLETPYTMATPSVSASPATGLADGDTVMVTGSDLQPTYAGPAALFPTGGWGVAQCSRAVLDDPSLWGVFSHCAIVPGAGPVDVPGSTASTAIQAQASITTIVGNTVDCTASPDACVVGMTRWEQDATTSTAFAPISFG